MSLILACAAIAGLPLAWRGTSCGHDFDFHLQSWLEVVQHWREGVLYPHWDASANYGAGEPRFVFYPPISWMLGALVGVLLPWNWTPLAFTLLAFIGCGLSFFAMAREWMTEDAAAVTASIYLLNPYLMFVAYERTAYGELLSAMMLPLLVLYGLRQKPGLLPLSLVIAALWLTNAPSAVMGCYLLAFLALVASVQDRSYRWVVREVGALFIGSGMAAFYIVPAAYEQRWVEIARAIAPGMRVEDSFLFERTGETYHDHVLRAASWIAVIMLFAAVAALVSLLKNKRHSAILAPLIAALAAIGILLLPFSDVIWHHAPKLKFLQFPWRWLLVLGVIMATLIGFVLPDSFLEATTRKVRTRAIAVLALAVLMSSVAASVFWQSCDDEDNIAAQRTTFRESGFEGTDEYTAIDADNGDIQQNLPPVRMLKKADSDEADSSISENPEWQADAVETVNGQLHLDRWTSERKEIRVGLNAPAYAVFRLMDYPAWQVQVNGQSVTARPHRDDGLLTVPLKAGQSTITIHYAATRDVELGRALSLLAFCIVIAKFAQTKRRRNLHLS
jgi:hypothetical protein